MQRRFREIFEDENKIKLFQAILNAFQGRNFDICQGHDKEWGVCKMHQMGRASVEYVSTVNILDFIYNRWFYGTEVVEVPLLQVPVIH